MITDFAQSWCRMFGALSCHTMNLTQVMAVAFSTIMMVIVAVYLAYSFIERKA